MRLRAGRVVLGRDDREALRAVRVRGELAPRPGHRAAVEVQLRAVGEGVLDRVRVEVLVDEILAVVPAADRLGLHRPGLLHHAGLVDVVDVEVREHPARRPQEAVEASQLVHHLGHRLRGVADHLRRDAALDLPLGEGRPAGAVHAVGAHRDDVADLAVLDAAQQFVARVAVPAHQADADLEVLLDRLGAELEHLPGGRAVHRDRLLHEDVEALLDGVLEMQPAEGRRRGQDDDVARPEHVHRLLVAVEAEELVVVLDRHPLADAVLQRGVAARQLVLEDVGHRHQLEGAVLGGHRVDHRARAAATGADEREPDRVALGAVHRRCIQRGQSRCRGHLAETLRESAP